MTVAWAPGGRLPAGYRIVERFSVLPAGPDRAFFVSLSSRRGAAAAVTTYNALRPPRRRLARRVVGLGLRTGVAQPLLGHQVDVGITTGATPQELSDALLLEHLRGLFGRPVVIAFGCGSGPYRKPVLQVFGTDGAALGYVKVGWNDWARDAVQQEAMALTACAAHTTHTTRLCVPELLCRSTWNGLDLLVTAPLPHGIRRVATNAPLPGSGVLAEVNAIWPQSVSELASSDWWASLRTRIETRVADPDASHRLTLLMESVERNWSRTPLRFGAWHGDFVPWNLARLGGRLYAWDWESSAQAAPVGFDALHFYFQVSFVAHQRPLEEAANLAVQCSRPVLADLGLAADLHDLLATLHLLELAVRHEEARSGSGDADERFFPAVLRVLERRLASPPGTARLHPAASSS